MYCFLIIGVQLFVLIILQVSYGETQSSVSLADFNKHFLTEYDQARTRLLSTTDPLLISHRNNVTLFYRGERTSIGVVPTVYQDLKVISHIPFTVYLLLFNVQSSDNALTSETIAKLKSYYDDIRTIRKSLNLSYLADDVLQRQFEIIDLSLNYLRSIFKSKKLNQIELKEFCLKARQLFTPNMDRAIRAQLDLFHSIVYPWYTNLFNETERQTVKAVITGPKSLRNGFFSTLYFKALLGVSKEQDEGNRVLYAEQVLDEPTIMKVLGSWLLDEYAGDAFYDDPSRLHRDLLMDEAVAHLKHLFPSKNI